MKVHRYQAKLFPVNAYLIEVDDGIIAVDATLGVSDGRALAAKANSLRKPLLGAIVTHAHPDHYGGLASLLENLEVPVYAVAGVDAAIRRDDPGKEAVLRPMFGDEWARTRAFPNRIAKNGERIGFGRAGLRVIDAGPCESPHDSWWILEDERGGGSPSAFVGDLVYSHMHVYLADGYYENWLRNLQRARRELPPDATLYMGHGEPASGARGLELLDWQGEYIDRFLHAMAGGRQQGLEGDALTKAVTARMQQYLPDSELLFLLQLSVPALQNRFEFQKGAGQ